MRRLSWPVVCLILAVVITIGFFTWYQAIAPVSQEALYADTTIRLTSNRNHVLFAGDCVLMQWDVMNTQRVLANEELVSANGEKTLCVDGVTQPTLQVVLLDGSEVTVTQPITILTTQPLFSIAALLTLALLGVALVGLLLSFNRAVGRVETVRSLVRGGLYMLISVGLMLLVLEIGLRLYFGLAGSRQQKIMYLYSLEDIRALQSNIIHVPYVTYVPDPAYEGHNDLGYRGPEIILPKPEGTFRIVTMGGSTTYSTGTTAEEAYPALLQSILRDEYGYTNIEVVNGGVSGYTTWEILTDFQFRVLELEPDMLIFYEAVNDLVVREQVSVDCYRGLNPQRGLNAQRGLFVERNAALPASALYRMIAIPLRWMPNPLALDSAFEPTRVQCATDPGDMTLEKRLASNTLIYYERNIRNLMVLAQANGVQPVISSWVYNVESTRPELWRTSIAEHNAITRQIADDMTIPYIDLVAEFPVDPANWEADAIHLVASGTREQAQRYAAFLVESDLLPKP